MSRMIAYGALSAATLTSASVGGYYLFNSGGHVEETEPGRPAPTPLSFENLESFKKSAGSNSVGIREYFEGLDISRDGESVADDLANAASFFDGLKANEPGAQSYLRIEHKKKEPKAAMDWGGKFAWLWVFATQGRGMITFGALETTDQKDFDAQAVLYLVQKEESGWKIKHRKESGKKKIVKDQLNDQFPYPSDTFRSSHRAGEAWGFMDKNQESILMSSAMCAWESCDKSLTEIEETVKVLRWKTDEGSAEKTILGSWFANSNWCKHLFGELGEKLMKLQTPKGTWTVDTNASSSIKWSTASKQSS